jgi:hypothetical protein
MLPDHSLEMRSSSESLVGRCKGQAALEIRLHAIPRVRSIANEFGPVIVAPLGSTMVDHPIPAGRSSDGLALGVVEAFTVQLLDALSAKKSQGGSHSEVH